jgi:hypothetical protein
MSRPTFPSARLGHSFLLLLFAAFLFLLAPHNVRAEEEREEHSVRLQPHQAGVVHGVRRPEMRATVVNFSELARLGALRRGPAPPVRPLVMQELEEPAEPLAESAPRALFPPVRSLVASPSPVSTFMGLDDVPMVDSSFIVIPPDCGGAVGPTRILQGLNNNYRILNKADGAVISTVGTATFWAPTGETALNGLTDPRTLYDPFNNRWIVEMQSVTTGAGDILIGVSQTSDPSGAWNLFKFPTGSTIDFPIVGFNKNWVVVTINKFGNGGAFQQGISLVANYAQLRAGVLQSTLFTQSPGTHFCTGPCITYSLTSDTLYLVTHLSSSGGTYAVDRITGTASAPAYTSGGTLTRTGGGWVQSGGNQLPQSAPNSGVSVCGATPCPIEAQDSFIRSAPVFRGGSIYYAQTVGLPAGAMTHTGVQWTRLTTPSGAFTDGGRIEEATATSSNGGKWYAGPHIAVNASGDFIVGYSQFSSAQHPSAGYSVHQAGDAAGSTRDPLIYKQGEDYYHKTFSTNTGRNRWGDFSQAQVDPSDDQSLWVVDEYAKNRPGVSDTTSGANSSRWSTYWAKVPFSPVVGVGDVPDLALNFVRSAFPNPSVAGAASVRFSLAQPAKVTIRFYNVAGRLVYEATIDGHAGTDNVYRWDGATSSGVKATSGVYFYQLSAPGVQFQNSSQRMVLLGQAGN